MAIAISDPFMADVRPTGIQRGRGGFYRNAADVPFVSDPSGEVCKTGDRKGEVKRLKYGSPSGVGRLVENDVGLTKFKQRNTLLGIGMDTNLAEACRDLVVMEADSAEFRAAADAIAVAADNLTRSWLAADRGTHGHAITEYVDLGRVLFNDSFIEDGLALGLSFDTQLAVAHAWKAMLANNGLEILAIEASCVDDRWRLAGTLDRIVRTTRDLTFVKPSGELVVIPANTVLILDIKFGKCRKAHPIQIASYAQSVSYDTDAETRLEWPWEIDQTHALIAHGDFGGDGRPVTIELVWVDLTAGREHGGQCVVDAKAWAARDDLFSVAQLDVEGAGAVPGEAVESPPPSATVARGEDVALPGQPAPLADPRVNDTPGIAGVTRRMCDPYRLTPDPARLALVDARSTLTSDPEQGADLSVGFDELWDRLRAEFDNLDPVARSWRWELCNAALRHHVPFHAQAVKTERSFWLNKATITLALGGGDEDILRALAAPVVGDIAWFAGIEAGHLLGAMSAAEAERLAGLVDAWVTGPGEAA